MTASVARFIESFIPENYNLFLDINRSEKTFTGNVAITGEAIDNHISLHQKDLTINSVLLDNESLNFQMDDANEAFHIELPETGVLTIFIEFSGRITDNMTGIYPSYSLTMVKRRKLFQHSLNLISLVKLFLVLMNQKQKQLLIFH